MIFLAVNKPETKAPCTPVMPCAQCPARYRLPIGVSPDRLCWCLIFLGMLLGPTKEPAVLLVNFAKESGENIL